jgi:PAS domain S-box-containing protein
MGRVTATPHEKGDAWRTWVHRLAGLPILLFILVAVILFRTTTGVAFEAPVLLATLNTLFCASVSFMIASLAAREYAMSRSHSSLWLGCGALLFAIADLLEALLLKRMDVSIEVHHITVCLAGACFMASAGLALIRKPGRAFTPASNWRLVGAYLGAFALVAGVVVAALYGAVPAFYAAGGESTVFRHVVLALTVTTYGCATLGFGILYRKTSTPFLLWYCLGLAMIGLGLGLAIPEVPGSPLSWLGRSAQYAGGLYMLIAILSEVRGPRGLGISLENAYRESEEKYRRLVASLPTALYTCDRQGYITLYNDRAVELWGCRARIGQDRWQGPPRFMRDDGTPVPPEQTSVAIALRECRPVQGVESIIERADGSRLHVLPHVELVYDAFGAITGAVNILVDVTREVEARLQADTARAEAENEKLRLEAVIEALPVGLSIADAHGDRILTNAIYEQIRSGVNAPPEDPPFAEEERALALAVNQGRTVLGQKLDIPRADGVRQHILSNIAPIRDRQGRISGGVVIEQDITELRRAEIDLIRMNRILKASSASDSAMMRATNETEYLQEVCRVVVECGYAMVWIGYARQDAEKTVWPVAYAGFEEGYLDTLAVRWDESARGRGPTGTAIRTGKASICRNMLTEPSFAPWREEAVKRGYASSMALPLRARSQTLGALTIYSKEPNPFTGDEMDLLSKLADDLAFGIEATRLRQAQARAEEARRLAALELARSNQDLEQFAHVTSHDLKEPLRMVTGFMTLLNDRYAEKLDAKGEEYIAFAVEATGRMQRLIDDLLTYARVGRGGVLESVPLAEVLEAVEKNLRRGIEETGATITHDPLPTIRANAMEMAQVFQNLLGNAIKFRSVNPPSIHIGARREGGQWEFSVRDNGIGLDLQYADRIFMIFQRLHTAEEYPGTGVGLAICKKIVERHGGRLWVESVPGGGATFRFTIPILTENP